MPTGVLGSWFGGLWPSLLRPLPGPENKYGEVIPSVIGTARVRSQPVYHGTPTGIVDGLRWDGNAWVAAKAMAADIVLAVCEAPVADITKLWGPKGPVGGLAFADWGKMVATVSGGYWKILTAADATAWSYYAGTAAEGMGHAGTAHVRFHNITFVEGAEEQIDFEVKGYGAGAGGESTYDAHPADAMTFLITDAKGGLGLSSSVLEVDKGIGGTAADSYRRYCSARGWYVSRAFATRASVLDSIASLLLATDSTAVLIDGKITIIPMGDQVVTRGAFTFTPTLTAVTIDPAECIHDQDEDPVRWERLSERDIYGVWPVTFRSRAKDYEQDAREYIDPVWTARYGTRRAPVLNIDWVLDPAHAFWVTYALAQRSINQRNKAIFRLAPRWSLLTPMDFITLRDVSGPSRTVRAISTEEQDDGSIEVTAIEWPSAVVEPIDLTQQAADGLLTPNLRNVSSATAELSNVAAGQVPRALLTVGQDFDNLWPNATSESEPPPGADLNGPEFGGRYELGAGAYAGTWVRALAIDDSSGAGEQLGPLLTVPCSPGQAVYLEAQVKTEFSTHLPGKLRLRFRNAAGASLQVTDSGEQASSAWALRSVTATAPAAAVKIEACWLATFDGSEPGQTYRCYFDALYLRRMVGSDLVVDGAIVAAKVAAGAIQADKILADSIEVRNLTVISDRDNLWPNPSSEITPPAGADTSQPDWADRYNAGAGAYGGSYVRQVTAAVHGFWIPCSQGAQFYTEAQAKRVSGSGSGGRVSVGFYPTLGNFTGGTVTAGAWSTSGSWAKVQVTSAAAPAGTTAAYVAYEAATGDTVQFDALYARRVLLPELIASEVITPSAGTGWSIISSGIRKSAGLVTGRIDLSAGASAAWTSMFTLPSKVWPQQDVWVPANVQDASTGIAYLGRAIITTAGVGYLSTYDNGTSLVLPFTIGTSDGVTLWAFAYPWS